MAFDNWQVDHAHSSIGFTVRHMVVSKVRGRFGKWSATLAFDETNPAGSSVEVSIDVASIDTGAGDRDTHLRSPDFFDVKKFPAIHFKSKRVQPKGPGRLEVVGDLTIRDVTRELALEVETGQGKDPWGNQRAAFTAQTSINRKDFGLAWNQVLETGGVLVSEKVEIELELEAVKSVAKAA